ncbi:MAG: hypothetical protein KBC43_03155 [Bacteroidales bacterium]|nr:hypothetical protein [Bacteroidales bacterium]
MDQRYDFRQQGIYDDYSLKSDKELLKIYSNKDRYPDEIIDIVGDILKDRKNLPETTEDEPVEEITVEDVYAFAADLLANKGKSPEEVRQSLIQSGLDLESADIVVNNLLGEIRKAKKERADKDILYGGLWFFGGLVVTAITYANAAPGGTYFLAWGAILFGGIQLVKGIVNSMKKNEH